MTAFWLKDFCQKIVPVRFREVQKEYFGKKRMSLHADIFFTKSSDGSLQKKTFFTCLYQCEQDSKDVLSINENAVKKLKEIHPYITKVFTKSNNAGCYHTLHSPDALHQICRGYDIKLLR